MPQEIVVLDSFMGDPREIQRRLSLKKTDKPDIKTRNKLLPSRHRAKRLVVPSPGRA